MNTIPITFNSTVSAYTVVGGTIRAGFTGLSAVLLNRGGRYPRRTLFQELEKVGFDYIISVEGPQERYDLEDLSSRFPFVRFVLLKEELTAGEQINLAAGELSSPLFFVLWNDLRIIHSGGAVRMAERLISSQDDIGGINGKNEIGKNEEPRNGYKRLCTVPLIQNSRFEPQPTLMAPVIIKNVVNTIPFIPVKEGSPSLYPYDGIGIYDRKRFISLGGFDGTLKSPYWQLMDFGFRAHLWGEEICSTQFIKLSYDEDPPEEDSTVDESYRRFYLKSIAPIFRGDYADLPFRRFPSYLMSSGGDPFGAWEEFMESRRWIKINRFRFRGDAQSITELWEDYGLAPEENPPEPEPRPVDLNGKTRGTDAQVKGEVLPEIGEEPFTVYTAPHLDNGAAAGTSFQDMAGMQEAGHKVP
ncbi:MAG: hypothetical protein LBP76_13130 [Treponema sp.]|jgi:hypothetical protein|nr:hypothetical protein [Treponema sp.]